MSGKGFLPGFTVAALSSLLWPQLPVVHWIWLLLALLGLACYWRRAALAGVLCGLSWFLLFFNLQLAWLQPLAAAGTEPGQTQHSIDGVVMAWQARAEGGALRLQVSRLD